MFYQVSKRWTLPMAVLYALVLSLCSVSQAQAQDLPAAADLILKNTTNAPMRIDVESIAPNNINIAGTKIPLSGKDSAKSLGLIQPGEIGFFPRALPAGNNFVVVQPQIKPFRIRPNGSEIACETDSSFDRDQCPLGG